MTDEAFGANYALVFDTTAGPTVRSIAAAVLAELASDDQLRRSGFTACAARAMLRTLSVRLALPRRIAERPSIPSALGALGEPDCGGRAPRQPGADEQSERGARRGWRR
jgi:hypothetical protein